MIFDRNLIQKSCIPVHSLHRGIAKPFIPANLLHAAKCSVYSASSSIASSRKLTGRKPSLQEIMADLGSFIHPS